jgi:phage gp36-like protein
MSYCSSSDITSLIPNDELVQLTNDSGGDSVDSSVITTAIDYVDNFIDGYLRGRYDLPLTSTPDELKYIAIDLVVFRLYTRRMYTNIPENIEARYKTVVKQLEHIQSGKFSLGIESSDAHDNKLLKTNKTTTTSTRNRVYDEDKWDEYNTW